MPALQDISALSTLFSKSSERSASLFTINHADHNDDHASTHHATPLLSVADFNGDGQVNRADIRALRAHLLSSAGDDQYHPLYDLNADSKINQRDLLRAISDLGTTVPLLDQQIAQATQSTMRYYGSQGVKNAIADGYLPFSQELKGHGIHYINPNLALEIGNRQQLDIQRPIGLNYNDEGNLIAVFYLRIPRRLQATPENPAQGLLVDPTDDKPSDVSFDTLLPTDWHHHHSPWVSGLGNLNPNSVYFEEDVPIESVVQRLQQSQFKVFPETDQYYVPKIWMLHGWFHSLNPDGTFAEVNPNISKYAAQELGDPHHELNIPLIRGTEAGESILGTAVGERINGFSGNDVITGNGGHDHLWGSYGDDLLFGDRSLQPQSRNRAVDSGSQPDFEHDDILYGGAGRDRLYGQIGHDKLFGGVGNDTMYGGTGDDLLRGGLGRDTLKGDSGAGRGRDSFVLEPGAGIDTIVDFNLRFDKLILVGGLTLDSLSIIQQQSNTIIKAGNQRVAVLTDVNANQLMASNVFTIA